MKEFMGRKFLIENAKGLELYERVAKHLPVCDYHCHLSPEEIADNRVFYDVGELMLEHDHYKWRIMCTNGISEDFITGKASYRDKFIHYAKALQNAPGNPLYHWTHMELKTYFDIRQPLTESNASDIYNQANQMMADGSYTTQRFIRDAKVQMIATTDDPVDSLEFHRRIAQDAGIDTQVIPTFRPDKIFNPQRKGYREYIAQLEKTAQTNIHDLTQLLSVYGQRMDYFEKAGCRSSDHGIIDIPEVSATYEETARIFSKVLSAEEISEIEKQQFFGFMLEYFAKEYRQRGWVMQLHLSAIRNQNTSRFESLGPDCGVDSVGDILRAEPLNRFMNKIEQEGGLPKTIFYTLNPASYYILATTAGNFAGEVPGKIQLGPAWWFCDHRDGICEQLKIYANTGVLGTFNGMLTDSRSFTSYVRHDYFRRILCSLLGEWIEAGEYADDGEYVDCLIRKICFENAANYFGIKTQKEKK